MVNLVKEFYQEKIEDDLQFMRYLQADAGRMQDIREAYVGEDWEVEEFTRHIIFLEAQAIEELKEQIQDDREDLKKLG